MSGSYIILIGGAPTTGKSTIARLLSERLKIPWISTDQLREVTKGIGREKDYPALFRNKGLSGDQFLKRYSAAEIVRREHEEAVATWKSVKAFIEHSYPWDSFIIEGIGILPRLVAKDFKKKKYIKPVFLMDDDVDRVRNVVFGRGIWGDPDTYSDESKEKEVEWALLFGQKLKQEALKFGYPLIEVQKKKVDVSAVLKALRMRE